ncbi:10231_t:CDS:2, partial [Paraglomus occultum]
MDVIKIAKVEEVYMEKGQTTTVGTLHLTTHQLFFNSPNEELW